jgi:uncharacterized protein Veg
MAKITVRFKSGRTKEIDGEELPRIKNTFPSVQVVKIEQAKPPKAKAKTVAEFNQISEEVEADLETNDKNTISGE